MVPLVLAAALTGAFVPGRYVVVPEKSEIRYLVRHPLHTVVGTSKAPSGSFEIDSGGLLQGSPGPIKVPISSFSSKNRNRDSNVQTVLGVSRHPDAIAVVRSVLLEAVPGGFSGTVTGLLNLHGIERPLSAPIKVVADGKGEIAIDATFSFNLSAHKVERPSLLFMPIDDRVDISCKLRARKSD